MKSSTKANQQSTSDMKMFIFLEYTIYDLWLVRIKKKTEENKRENLDITVQTDVTEVLQANKKREIDSNWFEVTICQTLDSYNERIVEIYPNVYRIRRFWVIWLSLLIWLSCTKVELVNIHDTDRQNAGKIE